jgi:hypothetical protein
MKLIAIDLIEKEVTTMTYSAPELLMIGAAQNVVLLGSSPSLAPDVCWRRTDEDPIGDPSDKVEEW